MSVDDGTPMAEQVVREQLAETAAENTELKARLQVVDGALEIALAELASSEDEIASLENRVRTLRMRNRLGASAASE